MSQISYQDAIEYMDKCDQNTIMIENFSEEGEYLIDGGSCSLLELELEENTDFNEYKFYICSDC